MRLPRLDQHAVPRPRLLAHFDDLAALTLVRGPMGAGKTTLVAGWASAEQQAGRTVLWLDGVVDDPDAVVGALASLLGFDLPEGVTPAAALTAMTPTLRVLDERLVVVIDGFDPVADALGAALMTVLDRCRMLHLVLCARERHDSILQMAGGVGYRVISMADLALTEDEFVAYAAERRLSVGGDAVSAILDATGGLAALIRTGLRSNLAESSDDAPDWWSWEQVREFIADAAFRALGPDDIVEVCALSHLAGMSLEVVHAALPTNHERVVRALHQVGGLERREDRLHVWLPAVVAEVLHSLPGPAPDTELAALHDRVIAELARSGQIYDAVALAQRTSRHEALFAVVKAHWWDIAAHDLSMLANALESLPDEILANRSVLMRHLTELIPDRVTTEPLADLEDAAWDDEQLREAAAGPDAGMYLDGVMISLMAARFRGDWDRAKQDVRRGMVMVAVMSQYTQHDLPTGIRRFFVQSGLVHLFDLDLSSAELAFRRGYGPDEHSSPDVLRREAANKLALIHAVKGHHVSTRSWLARADAIDPPTGWLAPLIESPRRMAEAILALDDLDQREVEHQLAELSATITGDELWMMELTIGSAASIMWGGVQVALSEIHKNFNDRAHLLGAGTLARAQLTESEASLLIASGRGTEAASILTKHWQSIPIKVLQARLLVLSGHAQEALAVLAPVTQSPHEFARLRVEGELLAASAHHDLGDIDLTRRYLERAALHPEFVSMFASVSRSLIADNVEVVPTLAPILRQLDARDIGSVYPESVDVISLTEREQVLLELLRTATSRESMARELFVSTNTIKTQLRGLYRKLEVTSREQAVLRAYEVGLLS